MFKKNLIISLLIIFILTPFCSNNDSINFYNANDPTSKYYISDRFNNAFVKRISKSAAELNWTWENGINSTVTKIVVSRYLIDSTNNSKVIDSVFVKELLDIKHEFSENDTLLSFVDNNLTFETNYEYNLEYSNRAGESDSGSVVIKYKHGFIRPDTKDIFTQISDVSCMLNIDQPDTLADSILVTWEAPDNSPIKYNIQKGHSSIKQELTNENNTLDNNEFKIEYCIVINDSSLWVNVCTYNFDFVFPAVDSFSVISFNKLIRRLLWRYPKNVPVTPIKFKILKEDEPYDTVNTTQMIFDKEYFVYYDSLGAIASKYSIIPLTDYHSGTKSNSKHADNLGSDFQKYYFVDSTCPDSIVNGFYVNYFEVSNNDINNCLEQFQLSNFLDMLDSAETDFFSLDINKPIRGAPYSFAKSIADSLECSLPTLEQWEAVASASTNNRIYPWGNSYPSKIYANFDNFYNGTLDVDDDLHTNQGRVLINKDYNIYGAYHIIGNIMEWTTSENVCYTKQASQNKTEWRCCKGGAWNSSYNELTIKAYCCMPENISDGSIGFRLIKQMPK